MSTIFKTIQRRVSCRTYSDRVVEPEKIKRIERYLASNTQGPFGSGVSFRLINFFRQGESNSKVPGTYGFVKGARLFIAGSVKKRKMAMEDFGYCMEKNILFLTYLGLGTCWLGATFKRKNFTSFLELSENDLMPAVTPVGYAVSRVTVRDSLIRFGARSNQRRSWDKLFFRNDLDHPLEINRNDPRFLVLEAVRLAPSASNRQPWRIIREEEKNVFHFFLKRTQRDGKHGPGISLQKMDMGIAMCHFELTARESGLEGAWQILQYPALFSGLEYIVTWTS